MSVRGVNTGRGRGRGRPRGSKNKPGPKPYQYTIYKPSPEIYDELFHLQKEPPVVTQTLPNRCPVSRAQTSIIDRRQTEGFTRYYYNVRITYDQDESGYAHEATAPLEEIVQVEMSQILKYVSRGELERYEQEDYAQQAHAEETARRAEADELAKRRLEKNARGPSISKLIVPVGTLELGNLEVQKRPRGRPRGRGRGRGRARGWGAGRGGLAATQAYGADTEELEQGLTEQETPESAMLDKSEDDETGEDVPNVLQHSSPNFARSSFVANSALPLSPVAVHRRLSRTLISPHLLPARESSADESTSESVDQSGQRNARSLSIATAQLELERDVRGQHSPSMDEESEGSENVNEAGWHRAKRQKMGRILSTSTTPQPPIRPSWTKQLDTRTQSLPSTCSSSTSDSGTSENETEEETIVAQRHRSVMEESPNPIAPNDTHQGSDVDMENTEDEEEYVVKSIISHSYENGKRYYLVSWDGYDDKSDWLPEEDLGGALELLTEYNNSLFQGKKKRAV